MIKALSEDYLHTFNTGSIEWVCNHSRNTQLALVNGFIDLALTYERGQEALAESEGWSRTIGCVFHDHFVLAGPASDPARIQGLSSMEDSFMKIVEEQALFHSRADASATMWKERSIWTKSGSKPWDDPATSPWYKQSVLSPSEALITADAAGAYLLTDRSTLLDQTRLNRLRNTTVFMEPKNADDVLMNSCYASVSTTGSPATHRDSFLSYLLGEAGQRIINGYGKEQTGHALFAPAIRHSSDSSLVGGLPRSGRWCSPQTI